MKKFIALLLVCFLLVGSVSMYANAAEPIENTAAWEIVSNAVNECEPIDLTQEQISEITKLCPSLKARYYNFYEVEPNDTLDTADRVYNDYMVVGTLTDYDVDCFKFVLDTTSQVVIGSGSTYSTFAFGIWDVNDECIAACTYLGYEDGAHLDGLAEILPAGTYYVCTLDMEYLPNTYAFNILWEPIDTHIHNYIVGSSVPPTCTTDGYDFMTCSCGDVYPVRIPATGHIYDNNVDGTCNVCSVNRETVENRIVVHMYRMYNPNTGEHFYTGSDVEKSDLIAAGWQYEGVGFTFPANTGVPVHRLFQPSTGEHLYTMDVAEMERLIAEGWNYEGIAFNSAYDTEAVQHRLHNPNATVGAYHFTFSTEEMQNLIAAGWEYQGIGWYSCWK